MDSVAAGKMAYKVLKEKYGNDYMAKLSKLAADARTKKAKAGKNEANLVLDTEASMV